MLRVKSKQPMEKLDMSRYNVEPPLPSQEKDVQVSFRYTK